MDTALRAVPQGREKCRIVSESEFAETFKAALDAVDLTMVGSVTGPGRSGAVAAVYASHYLGVPFIPFGSPAPEHLGTVLIVDTAVQSGRTIRKAVKRYEYAGAFAVFAYQEPPRVAFWYEAPKPQRYRHENRVSRQGEAEHIARSA